tara:strand:+ start:26475 stop:26903 length:429 start_codon:yes stop_codon:yes gene_type:complete
MENKKNNKVIFKELDKINVVDGDVLKILKKSEAVFSDFGEAYFSMIKSGSIKGWKLHKMITCNLVVPFGEVEFVISKDFLEFDKYIIGINNYGRLTIPPNCWFAFKGRAHQDSIILNITDFEHNPDENVSKLLTDVDYDWSN